VTAPLTIWCDLRLDDGSAELALLREGVAPHALVLARGADARARLGEADVAFGQPDAEAAAASARLRWIQVSTAGYTAYDRPAFAGALARRGALFTNSSSVYSDPCAQHLLAFMLADARQLPRSLRHQLTDRAWDSHETRAASYLLGGQRAVLVGMGAIALRLIELLAPLGLEVTGVRRRPRGDEPVRTVPLAALDAELARAHHVVCTLPASDETFHLFDAARLGAVRAGAVFYNIGRGSTVDLGALGAALDSGRLRAAYLDVTDPEPLPPDHPLWRSPACVITPHAAGGHADEQERLVRHFLANLRRFEAGQPLADRIVWP
jgi:phosphoglycerate dehydrogenase-like enzyme